MAPREVKRVVYLLPGPPDEHALSQYGYRELTEAGFVVEALDLSALVLLGERGAEADVDVPVRRILSPADLSDYLASSADGALFLDFVGGLEPPLPAQRVLAAVGEAAPWAIVFAAPLPPLPEPRDAAEQMGRRMRRLSQVRNPKRLANFVATRMGRVLRTTPDVPLPALVFSTRSPSLESFIATTGLPETRVVPINSYDYDTFLGYKRDRRGVLPAQEDIAVFLDEAASSHPDFELFGTTRFVPTDQPYSAAMRRLFDEVEAKTGLRVVIAAHPRADYDSRPGFFGDREVVKGATLDLTARSRFVIGHCTTALSFAVLLGRPILLTTTAEMERAIYALQVDRMEAALALDAVNVDEPGALEEIDWDWNRWPRAGYPDYERRYIRSPEADGERTTWQIVAETLKAGL